MAENTEPEMPQENAAASQSAGSPDAGAGETPEIAAPMLDVHPPHGTIHT